jgi:hypothetical protein
MSKSIDQERDISYTKAVERAKISKSRVIIDEEITH